VAKNPEGGEGKAYISVEPFSPLWPSGEVEEGERADEGRTEGVRMGRMFVDGVPGVSGRHRRWSAIAPLLVHLQIGTSYQGRVRHPPVKTRPDEEEEGKTI